MKATHTRRGRQPDPIACTKTYYYPNGTSTVLFPDISDEENERRMNLIKQATIEVLKEKYRIERERKRKELQEHETKINQQ